MRQGVALNKSEPQLVKMLRLWLAEPSESLEITKVSVKITFVGERTTKSTEAQVCVHILWANSYKPGKYCAQHD